MKTQIKLVIFTLMLSTAALGCDKIAGIFQKKEQAPASLPQTSEPEAQAPQAQEPLPENVVARVGSWTLTKEQFNERLNAIKEAVPAFDANNAEAKQLILDELVNQQLLVMDAEKSGLAKQKDVVDAIEEFRRTVLIQEKARQLTQDIKVTEEEAKAFYEEKKDLLVEPPQWHVRELVVDNEQKANELLTQILNGGNFAQLAKENSISESAANNGDLGMLTDVPFAEMANPLLSLEAGKVSNVFKGPQGFYIIRLDEKIEGKQLEFDAVKDQIISNQTLMKQQQKLLQHLQTLKNEYKVEVKPELLK